MSSLTSAMARSWSGVSSYGKRRLHLLLPRRVVAERRGRERRPRAEYSSSSSLRQVGDRPADARLGALPLAAAQAATGAASRRRRSARRARSARPGPRCGRCPRSAAPGSRAPRRRPRRPMRRTRPAYRATPWSMCTTASPGCEPLQQVARHDPAKGPRPTDAHGAEELAVGDQHEAFRTAGKAGVQAALDQHQTARRRRRGQAGHGGGHDAGIVQQLRQARRLVAARTTRYALAAPPGDRLAQVAERRRRQRPARASRTGCRPAARRRHSLSQVQLQRSRRGEPLSSRRAAPGRRSARPGQLARGVRAPRAARRPAPRGISADVLDVRRLVDDPDRVAHVVERRRRREDAGPDLGRVARVAAVDEPGQVGRQPLRQPVVRHRPRRSRSHGPASGRQEELARRAGSSRPVERRDPALVGRIEGAQRLDLVAEPLDAHGQWLPGGKTSTMPPRRTNSPRPATSGTGLVAQATSSTRSALLADPPARPRGRTRLARQVGQGASVRWKSAWTLATRTRGRAGRPGRQGRHAGGRLVADQARAFVRQRRRAARASPRRPGHRTRPRSSSATRSAISASRAIQISRSPVARATAAARNLLAPCGIAGVGDVAQARSRPSRRGPLTAREPGSQRLERAAARRGGR